MLDPVRFETHAAFQAPSPSCPPYHHSNQDLTPWWHLISDLDIKDAVAQESAQRPMQYRRQSVIEPVLQDTAFAQRKSTVFREWGGKIPDASYERKLKSLMEKGTEPKMEMMKMLKPEEVLSCR